MHFGGGGIKLDVPIRGTAMPENKTLDPFKPTQPRIPGVSDPDEKAKKCGPLKPSGHFSGWSWRRPLTAPPNSPARLKRLWVGLTLGGALIAIFLLFGLRHKPASEKAEKSAAPAETPAPISAPLLPDAVRTDANLPMGPGTIATKGQLAKPWSAKRFYFREPLTSRAVPAMVVRLPGGAFWGFSLREPYGTCELEFVTDLRKLHKDYDFTASHPMVADPCNKTVFDLTQYGNSPAGLVRGEIEKGPGWRPPLAIEIRTQDNQVIAVRMEH